MEVVSEGLTGSSGSVFRHVDDAGDVGAYTLSGGEFLLKRTGGTSILNPTQGDFFNAFCLEPRVSIGSNATMYEVSPLEQAHQYSSPDGALGTAKANYIRELMYQVHPDFAESLTATEGLAIQISLWEIARDNNLGHYVVTEGAAGAGDVWFRALTTDGGLSAAAILLAQTWLDSYVNDGVMGPMLNNLYTLTYDGKQDIIFQAAAVPVPPSLLLFGSALLGFAGFRRHRKSKAA
ncbi:MAG: PEP-CTERM sorting domain-containing protein [Sedimenticola sp.]